MLCPGLWVNCSLWARGYCLLQYLLIPPSCTIRHKIFKASVQMQFIYNQRLLRELTGKNLVCELQIQLDGRKQQSEQGQAASLMLQLLSPL